MLQKLDLTRNRLKELPDELANLTNLQELLLEDNWLPTVPVSVLSKMTALQIIDIRKHTVCPIVEGTAFRISCSLLPILHPGLVRLDLRQVRLRVRQNGQDRFPWDPISRFHLVHAEVEVAHRRTVHLLF